MIAIPGLRKKKKMTFYYGRISSNRRSPGFNHAMSSSIANIGELCTEGWLKEAANILLTMQNPRIDVSPYLKILQTCIAGSSPLEDKSTHFFVRSSGYTGVTPTFLRNKLINLYSRSGSLDDARKVFDNMKDPDIFSWNMIIAAYVRHGNPQEALALFKQMQLTGVQPDQFTFASIVSAFAQMGALEKGIEIHQRIIEGEFLSDVVVANTLINMYAKCGSIQKGRELFDKMERRDAFSWTVMIAGYAQNGVVHEALRLLSLMPSRNVISWNAMIAGYSQHGFLEKAMDVFKQMQLAGVKPDSITFASIVPACAKMGAFKQGMENHQRIVKTGFLSDVIVSNVLIDMYAKCGSIEKARQLFDVMRTRDVDSWNSLISGYVQNDDFEEALRLFNEMPQRNVVSWNEMIVGYVQNGVLDEALRVFQEMPQRDVISWNVMISGYIQNGVLDEALRLFNEMPQRNVVSWTAMIVGYAQNGFVEKALQIFKQMQLAGIKPNSATFASILPASAKVGALDWGLEIHQRIIESGFSLHDVVATSLIDMYAKCGNLYKAHKIFDKIPQQNTDSWNAIISGYARNDFLDKAIRLFKGMPQPNVVSWTAMIAGYAQAGQVGMALELFKQMRLAGMKPNWATFASILPVCSKKGLVKQGMEIHQRIIECRYWSDVVVVTALIDMYAKCGSLHKAHRLFDKMHHRNEVSWTAMIAGYAMHGSGKDALELFELMKHSGTNPNHISFVCVLFACSHAGLVDEGCKYFSSMGDSYCIIPIKNHYVCIVDLLGRAGFLEETLNFIIKMPIKPDVVMWMCLLSSCRSHKSIWLAEFVATILSGLDPEYSAPYVILSNIYAELGRWSDVQKVRESMKDGSLKKIPGSSWIDIL
ncbi:pentatricopeptide repeat-containing protein At1g09410, mitochondrial [Cryptomeria japonica]|uniref:pentatricopeptide repeat-containing protein At1g09410, mitochondrial n=1 Tax=Cryptomeria japonica TaxID=3369 RepID=UPI0027DA1483|nr:pentatricopeptide repeat-containing protein At1g09410, mitochondrial [Cryptomeria japonica]XP_057831606.2 pentatricopeptide repeat-containing protein At1g09410, mitochondrial [Cryptomeria japonica]XP_057831607.2 pentatricopeptide repeat-containing protein At1g09410, mitochondrial [Cryptomeria japonica]XP_057831608.2 pentatricopeptide repeat-containing protein At1g09410, mitochondrial [Cryptomeria japonica]XP_057831609.2 pentatricopeptide repeat-containing protein At1g09410, mitochondrial [Cr